jgi:hypothetical protein
MRDALPPGAAYQMGKWYGGSAPVALWAPPPAYF